MINKSKNHYNYYNIILKHLFDCFLIKKGSHVNMPICHGVFTIQAEDNKFAMPIRLHIV